MNYKQGGEILNLGTKIRLHRTAANMTQKELGDKLGVTPSAVTRWESGECFPRGEKLIKLGYKVKLVHRDINKGK